MNNKYFKLIILITLANLSFARSSWVSKFAPGELSTKPKVVAATGTIEVAFSPHGGATNSIVNAINQAKQSILVAAYSFTSKDISKALVDAKNRGVDVQIILDKSQAKGGYSSARFFANQQVPLRIDHIHAIFHDKFMVIDGVNIITGSFNFTNAAENKNAENLLILRGNKELANLYIANWKSNWQKASPYSLD